LHSQVGNNFRDQLWNRTLQNSSIAEFRAKFISQTRILVNWILAEFCFFPADVSLIKHLGAFFPFAVYCAQTLLTKLVSVA
jgi:hypothetical protein